MSKTDVLESVLNDFANNREVAYQTIPRPWNPGGGSTLFHVTVGKKHYFLKAKATQLLVESKLESEKSFSEIPSLKNEHEFIQRLKSLSENFPQYSHYIEKDGHSFLFLEYLTPFETAASLMSSSELVEVYRQIEAAAGVMFSSDVIHTDIHEKNIACRGKTPIIVDFEEARTIHQNTPFEQSLDVIGRNSYGDVGSMPDAPGRIAGRTCLTRLKAVFDALVISKLDTLVKECNFDAASCPFLTTLDHGKDERIYQSIVLPGISIAGQRPVEDKRADQIAAIADQVLDGQFTYLDIGCNLGRFNIEMGARKNVRRSIGVEAFDKYVEMAGVLAFIHGLNNTQFIQAECGNHSLYELIGGEVDLVTIYSVYHHIRNKKKFLTDLKKLNPKCLMLEMAVQPECYDGKTWQDEIQIIAKTMGMVHINVVGQSSDYHRPIVVVSAEAIDQKAQPAKIQPRQINKHNGPKVSVVLPTYNRAQQLPSVISNVFAQTFQDFELIIVNDGSTDGTAEYLSTIKNPKIRVINQANTRLPGALNTGFAAAGGEYFTWISDDNYCSPIFLEALAAALDANPECRFAYSAFAWIDGTDRILGIQKDQNLSYNSILAANPGIAAFMYTRDCLESVGIYDTSIEGAEDWDMWLRITEKHSSVYVPEILYYFRVHDKSMTSYMPDKIRQACRTTFEKSLGMLSSVEARSDNSLSLERLFPTLNSCKDLPSAKFHGCFDLGTRLLGSSFDASGEACKLLETALTFAPGAETVETNLAVAYARLGRWADAEKIIQRLKNTNNQQVRSIIDGIIKAQQENNPATLWQTPLFTLDKAKCELFIKERALIKTHSLTATYHETPVSQKSDTLPEAAQPAPKKALKIATIESAAKEPQTKKPLRVTYLIHNILGVTGGNRTLLQHIDALIDFGHAVTIVTYSGKPEWCNVRANVIQVPRNQKMAGYVPESDVVIATYFLNAIEFSSINAPVKMYYAQGDQLIFEDAKVSNASIEIQNQLKETSRSSYLMPGVKFIPNSHNLASAVERDCGRKMDGLIPVCVDQSVFKPLGREAGVPNWRILIVGPDITGYEREPLTFKGIAETRRALEILKERNRDFTAIRISNTPPEIFRDFECEFYTVPSEEAKTQIYGSSDILIYASHYDSCPRPPQEAMAAGIAVVCTATTGAKEYCVDGENSLLIPINSPESIADAVERLMDDADLRNKLINGGLATAAAYPREREWIELESLMYKFLDESKSAPQGTGDVAAMVEQAMQLAAQGDTKSARKMLWKATETDPNYAPTYYNLASLLVRDGHIVEASEHACRALELDPSDAGAIEILQKTQTLLKAIKPAPKSKARKTAQQQGPTQSDIDSRLRRVNALLAATYIQPKSEIKESKPSVSLCMIVRDEEAFLADCLKSVKGLVSEIIIVDTGSKDRTIEIAKSSGANLQSFKWNGSYSDARNHALKFATGDWILSLDADERLDKNSISLLIEALKSASADAYDLTICNYLTEGQHPEVEISTACRLFRNRPQYRFKGKVHEQIGQSIIDANGKTERCQAAIYHHGYKPQIAEQRKKHAKYVALLRKEVETNPNDFYFLHHLGAELAGHGKHKEAIPVLEQVIKLLPRGHNFAPLAYARLAESLMVTGKSGEALKTIQKAEKQQIAHPQLSYVKGNILRCLDRNDEAAAAFETAMAIGRKGIWEGDTAAYGYKANLGLAAACIALGDRATAIEHIQSALKARPDNKDAKDLLAKAKALVGERISPTISRISPTISRPKTRKQPKLSLCMIVRNEEKFIAQCLDSAKDIVDEMIIVDTGSTDRTIEIVKSYGAKVYEFPWNDSYADARNESLKHATGDWILSLDADEEISKETAPMIRETIADPHYDGYALLFKNPMDDDKSSLDMTVHYVCRLYKNNPKYRYESKIHEHIEQSIRRDGGTMSMLPIVIMHYGYNPSVVRERGKHERYVRMLTLEVDENPDSVFYLHHLSSALCAGREFEKAIPYLQHACDVVQPKDAFAPILFAHLTNALREVNKISEAVATVQRAEKLGIKSPQLHFCKGSALVALNRPAEAIDAFEEAIRTGRGVDWIGDATTVSYKADFGLASAYFQMKNYAKAIEYAELTLAQKPGNTSSLELLVKIYEATGDLPKMEKCLLELHNQNPTEKGYIICLGDTCERQGRFADAIKYFESIISISEEKATLRVKLGSLAESQGNPEEARKHYERAIELDADAPDTYNALGMLYNTQEKYKEALDCFSKAIEVAPNYTKAHFNAGDVLYSTGNYQQAAELYTSGLALDPNYAPAFLRLGNCYCQMNAFDAAAIAYKKTLEIQPNNTDAANNLALAEDMLCAKAA
ncbi:MAG: tetratricopeptide repeat protein [Armatimonadetes bacterium]|nr:tetratricopeptide repeat protein [Armatimonadota bacterium]